jgi:Lrp/AsnC family leucine-responsive transcriptional regulator
MESPQNDALDSLDRAILTELQGDGRISNAELANRINLSPPATLARIRRLEQKGYIRQYTALLDPERIGYDMLCFVHISLQLHQPEQIETIQAAIQEIPEVLECYHVTGEFDYLLKVIVRHRKDLQRFIVDRLTPIPGVARIYTSLALSEIKSSTVLPVD